MNNFYQQQKATQKCPRCTVVQCEPKMDVHDLSFYGAGGHAPAQRPIVLFFFEKKEMSIWQNRDRRMYVFTAREGTKCPKKTTLRRK